MNAHTPETSIPREQMEVSENAPGDSHERQSEIEPPRESAETVRQLLDAWKLEYDQTDNHERKSELAYLIVKLSEAVQAARLSPDEVTIREAGPGVLGFYVPSTGEIAITPAGLELRPEKFGHILTHESTHAGKMTGRPIGDEGLTEIHTVDLRGPMAGVYKHEQRLAEQAFTELGLRRVLEEYDFDKPKELIKLFLETEWTVEWKRTWQNDQDVRQKIVSPEGRRTLLDENFREWTERVQKQLTDAAPRLVERAEAEGFDFAVEHGKILTTLGEQNQRT